MLAYKKNKHTHVTLGGFSSCPNQLPPPKLSFSTRNKNMISIQIFRENENHEAIMYRERRGANLSRSARNLKFH